MDSYLIDGYNFLFRTHGKDTSLEKKRQTLLELLNEELSPLNLHVTIVFDGADPIRPYAQRGRFDSLEVIYTPEDQTADHYIIETLEHARHPANYIVVSVDRDLTNTCKRLGGRILSIDAFLNFIEKKQKKVLAREVKTPWRTCSREIKRLQEIFEKRLRESQNSQKDDSAP